jgi:hypothetical protein
LTFSFVSVVCGINLSSDVCIVDQEEIMMPMWWIEAWLWSMDLS